ncbi:MAG: AraC family transcriptional regulator [Oscillospiraceae bacterium]|nr:AraC family transcriptional regulator [Oscillospiraceae bacterium]
MNNSILLTGNARFEPHLSILQKLPFIVHRQMRYPAGGGCRSNLHKNIEILRFLEGNGQVICGDRVYPVAPGDVVIVNSYVAHRVCAETDICFSCLIVSSDFCSENGMDVTLLDFDATPGGNVPQLLDKVTDAYVQEDSLWQLRVRSAVLALLVHLGEKHTRPKEAAVTEDLTFQSIIDAIGYIKDNLSRKLTVEEIADRAGFSKYYFLRLFKKITGCTVIQYVNLLRCEQAKDLLRTGNHSVKEVAALCGFENLSYFTGVFKKHTGTLPNAYKQESRK